MERKKERTKGRKAGKSQTTLGNGFLVPSRTMMGPPGVQVSPPQVEEQQTI
jgi:hypothetical protein